ncbi:hypothetical protein [Pseudooceanicola nanhaiensis]|uniref:hypothetical protein n=1 Tax=Pseudooceanicola nanhaiensis TaxID=375761 RepID=UPI001CD4ACA7|nr:hypothetical protein [Pseudooceanicola nanhaiensis]MCA0920449.1 hypothetical protein [Pseudooceanicola nanhaiensis]
MTNRVEADGKPVRATPVFLVLETDALIATDIADALSAQGPCRVVMVKKPAEIPVVLDGIAHVTAALLEMRYGEFLDSGLPELLGERGARIVLTAGELDRDKIADKGWFLLIRPFTDIMIRRMLPPAVPPF